MNSAVASFSRVRSESTTVCECSDAWRLSAPRAAETRCSSPIESFSAWMSCFMMPVSSSISGILELEDRRTGECLTHEFGV